MSTLRKRAKDLIKKYGSVRKAADTLGVNYTVLNLLANGRRKSASAFTLHAMGLKKETTITEAPGP
jgi:hypothetical protein